MTMESRLDGPIAVREDFGGLQSPMNRLDSPVRGKFYQWEPSVLAGSYIYSPRGEIFNKMLYCHIFVYFMSAVDII
jgi:hypothetical protein